MVLFLASCLHQSESHLAHFYFHIFITFYFVTIYLRSIRLQNKNKRINDEKVYDYNYGNNITHI
jgi:hypothetical protein